MTAAVKLEVNSIHISRNVDVSGSKRTSSSWRKKKCPPLSVGLTHRGMQSLFAKVSHPTASDLLVKVFKLGSDFRVELRS